jgi:hypothetical protein
MLTKLSRFGIILIGSLVVLAIIFPNGFFQCFDSVCGLAINKKYFHDSLWHIALGRAAFNSDQVANPAMSGSPLVGYNFLLDYLIFLTGKLGVDPLNAFYHFWPVVFILAYPILLLRYCREFKLSAQETTLTLFFAYFGSSFGFLFSLLHTHSLTDSALWQFPSAQTLESPTILYNLQFAFSWLLIIWALPLLKNKVHSPKDLGLMLVVSALATGFKFYAGLTLVSLFGFNLLINTLKAKKIEFSQVMMLFVIVLGFVAAVFWFYSPGKVETGSIFALAPFSFSQKMIEEPNLFYLRTLSDARYYLYEQGGFSPRLVAIELFSVGLFVVFNLGSRTLLLLKVTLDIIKKRVNEVDLAYLGTFLVGLTFALLFVQKGDWFNTLQFVFYGVFLLNFSSGTAWAAVVSAANSKFKLIIFLLLGLLTIPGCLELFPYYLRNSSTHTLIPQAEVRALKFLAQKPSGSVLTGRVINYSTIPALSGQSAYLSDPQVLQITGLEFGEREKLIKDLLRLPPASYPTKYFYLDLQNSRDRQIKKRLASSKQWQKIYKAEIIELFEKTSLGGSRGIRTPNQRLKRPLLYR